MGTGRPVRSRPRRLPPHAAWWGPRTGGQDVLGRGWVAGHIPPRDRQWGPQPGAVPPGRGCGPRAGLCPQGPCRRCSCPRLQCSLLRTEAARVVGRGGGGRGQRLPKSGHTYPGVRRVFRSRACGSRAGHRAGGRTGVRRGSRLFPHSLGGLLSVLHLPTPWEPWSSQAQDQSTCLGATQRPRACEAAFWPPGGSRAAPRGKPGPRPCAPHLRVPAWSQRLSAALTAQARPVPVFAEGRHLLSWEMGEMVRRRPQRRPPSGWGWVWSLTKVDPLVAARAHVGFAGERSDARGWGEAWRGVRGAGPLPRLPPDPEPSAPLLGPFGGPLALRSSARAAGTSMGPVTCGPSAEGFS